MVDYETYEIKGQEAISFLAIGYGALFFISYLFYKSLPLSLASGFLVIFLITPYKKFRISKRYEEVSIQFRDLLLSLDSSLAAGRSGISAFEEARDNLSLIHSKDAALVQELTYLCRDVIENRNGVEQLLIDWARRCRLEDVRNFVDVYVTCRKTGGDMGGVVRECLHTISEKMAIESEIKTMLSHKKLEGRVIGLMPIAVIGFLNIFSPAYLQVMYTTVAGRGIMTMALITMLVAIAWSHKLMKVRF